MYLFICLFVKKRRIYLFNLVCVFTYIIDVVNDFVFDFIVFVFVLYMECGGGGVFIYLFTF